MSIAMAVLQESVIEEAANMRWGTFKGILADAVVAHLQPIQQKYTEVMADEAYLDEVRQPYTVIACQHFVTHVRLLM